MPRIFNQQFLSRLFILLLISIISLASVSAEPIAVDDIRIAVKDQTTRIVIETRKRPAYKVFTLSDPERLVIDIANTKLSKNIARSNFANTAISDMRHAQRKSSLRLVFDLKQRVTPNNFLLAPNAKNNYRLVLDLSTGKSNVSAKKKPANSISSAPIERRALRDVVIAIDAGHGGKDPGAIGYAGTYEKTVVLQIAKRLKRLLDAQPGMRAVLTRSNDRYLTLRTRTNIARKNRADLFISVHADAVESRRAYGSSVYVLSKRGASSEAAKILARSQNAADMIGGVSLEGKDKVLQHVILDLSQTATIDASTELADNVITNLSRLGKTKKKVGHAGFVVLKSPDIPSILVETAFISNRKEEKKLRSPKHQEKMAKAIFNGIRRYLEDNAPEDSKLAQAPSSRNNNQHIIRRGETLSGVAQRYGVSVKALRLANGIKGDKIHAGQKLKIPRA
ncbi:MAG: N-acetylmuramoyl-L-alanine amidase [Gammaproteobacteria bacterium]|nr:N-acetylmuramoyl-L-alanine amidase [Gammaproteobacteria bacterium]